MRLTVKNYKKVEWMSEETECFTASLYLDGKRIGTAQNDGHGGPDNLDFVSKDAEADFDAAVAEWLETVQDDPKFQIEGKCYADAESFVAEACQTFTRQKEMKRDLKGYGSVVRIERPKGWMTEIQTIRFPEGYDREQVVADKSEDGDTIFVFDADGGLRFWDEAIK
jgi:hypothetical protein